MLTVNSLEGFEKIVELNRMFTIEESSMAIGSNKEIKYYFCHDHLEVIRGNYLQRNHPGYKFNTYNSFANHTCSFSNCRERAYFECIGIHVPYGIPADLTPQNKVSKEIFNYAKQILDNGTSADRLTVYLKSLIVPQDPNFISNKLIRYLACAILKKLKIDERQSLSDVDKERILTELRIYPIDDL